MVCAKEEFTAANYVLHPQNVSFRSANIYARHIYMISDNIISILYGYITNSRSK